MKKKLNFDYLIDKIKLSEFENIPFRHIYIEDFFTNEQFLQIVKSDEIKSPVAKSNYELINGLVEKGFSPIEFPGCITNVKKYIDWHENNEKAEIFSTCEGFGMALRLFRIKTKVLNELNLFLASEKFNRAIAEKFNIDFNNCIIDGGIQKYLDGYEISPHPDIRKKAATFMVNINPHPNSEQMDHHTHYLKFKDTYSYVKNIWSSNKDFDRTWVPWSWTESIKQQFKNNSIVLFSPSDDTMHAVKANYDHLITQRTQLYGNLWYKTDFTKSMMDWKNLDYQNLVKLQKGNESSRNLNFKSLKNKVVKLVPDFLKNKVNVAEKKSEFKVGDRNI